MNQNNKPLRPTQFAEEKLLLKIINGEYQSNDLLPSERELASNLGVTRPTLRETLQRLSREGWVTIQHGKPTRVNDFWHEGGLGIIKTLTRVGQDLSPMVIEKFLEARIIILPAVAQLAVMRKSESFGAYLAKAKHLDEKYESYVEYDWNLQYLMADLSGNAFFTLILNDFEEIFKILAESYFKIDSNRQSSQNFYQNLYENVLVKSSKVEGIVRQAMVEALEMWKSVVTPKT